MAGDSDVLPIANKPKEMVRGSADGEDGRGSPRVSISKEDGGCGCCAGRAELTPEELARRQRVLEHEEELVRRAKKNAENTKPPSGISLLARPMQMGNHFGVGIGLYFQMLEWLIILFACITLLAFPFWIVINQSVFLDEANKDNPEFGFKVFEDGPDLLKTTFAAIVGPYQDPNNTLTYMSTKLGNKWHGPQKKNDFLLWISILDVVGVVLMIFFVTYFTWRADKFEDEVDASTFEANDYAVLATGLPRDAGVHEVGHFFSRFGEVVDVTLVLDMQKVLTACARASKLNNRRVLLHEQLELLPSHHQEKLLKRIQDTEDEIIEVLKSINDDMNCKLARRKKREAKRGMKAAKRKLKSMPSMPRIYEIEDDKSSSSSEDDDDEEEETKLTEDEATASISGRLNASGGAEPAAPRVGSMKKDLASSRKWDGKSEKKFVRKSVYNTKAAFVTFMKSEDQQTCLKETPSPGWRDWIFRRAFATDSQIMRGRIIRTNRACAPTDYIYENICIPKQIRLWRQVGIRLLYLIMIIACALIVSALASRTRIDLDYVQLDWVQKNLAVDIGRAGDALPTGSTNAAVNDMRNLYEQAMQTAGSTTTVPDFSEELVMRANFTDYCEASLAVCSDYYSRELQTPDTNVTLTMAMGRHFKWDNPFNKFAFERRLLRKLHDRAPLGKGSPNDFQGVDIGLSACLACYCQGLSLAEEETQKTGAWLSITESHCWVYTVSDPPESGTEAGISVVIAALNVSLKQLVQILAAQEKAWTRSATESSFCVVAYISQLLNSVLVVLLVNARPNARSTPRGDRVDEDDIQWLRYIILDGSFDDFSNHWYDYVGESLIILLFIQCIFPLINVFIEVVIKWVQRMLVYLRADATQDCYDDAYNFPDFLLQQRVADVMLSVSVALLFCSGMPLCAGVVVLVFCIASLMDRYAVTAIMNVNRYDAKLPRLILGLLPWAVFLHCCFGLWMHSYFMFKNWDSDSTSVFIKTGKDQLERQSVEDEARFGTFLSKRTVESRIGQPNAFGLLLLAFIMALWLLYWNTVGWFLPMFRSWVERKEQEEAGLKMKSRLRLLRKILAMRNIDVFAKLTGAQEEDDDEAEPTFEELLATETLRSLPTYRLPFIPRYAGIFSGGLLESVIWYKMMGPHRYTRLVPVKVVEPYIRYTVEVKTSDILGAGTDSNVLIAIYGIKDGKVLTTGLQHLDNVGDDFERNQLDVYDLRCRDVGLMTHIEIRSCGTGFGGDWHLESVKVIDEYRGMNLFFPCNKWLTASDTKSLVQILKPTFKDGQEMSEEQANVGMKIKASDVANLARLGTLEGARGETITGFVDALCAQRTAEDKAREEESSKEGSVKDDPEAAVKLPQGDDVEMRTRIGWRVTKNLLLRVDSEVDSNIMAKDMQKYGLGKKLSDYVASIAASLEEH